MKLIGTASSPFVRKVRIVLEEKHIAYEYVRARSAAPGSPVPQLNPLGKIPVLVRDNGAPLYDSPVIVEYLDGLAAEPKLIPLAFDERIEVKRWEALGDGITEATVAISHDRRKPRERWETPEWYEKHRLKIDRGLATMDKDLGAREFCHGSCFGLADVAAGYALGYIDFVLPEIDWRKRHPNLKRLAETLAMRPSFRETPHKAS